MGIAIRVENLSKAYYLGEISTGTVSRDLERWWAKKRGKEDPFLKIGEVNDIAIKGNNDVVWSLKNINFEIQQGDAVGIIGRNGAGKSTLLKILSRVTSPTSGLIKAKGRIASLLEVGTGFHPDLTGRENIFLNGAILGMRKYEIVKKFDEIVDFAGIERYIDTPVKRYSSGMYVRLAFAVAAHLESEILLVDEVLAVGDYEFQKKCIGKMNDVTKGEGRTVLFVSHNMGAIKGLCNKGIFLEKGNIIFMGDIDKTIEQYYNKQGGLNGIFEIGKVSKDERVIIQKIVLSNQDNIQASSFKVGDDLVIKLFIESLEQYYQPYIYISLGNKFGVFTGANSLLDGIRISILKKGMNIIKCIFKNLPLIPQEYFIYCGVRAQNAQTALSITKEIGSFIITSQLRDVGLMGEMGKQLQAILSVL